MKKDKVLTIIECLVVFFMIFIYNSFFYGTYDHIIDFTHCYSIANGLKIYKDFNIVVGPVYPTLMAFLLKLFGKNFLVFDIVNSIIVVIIYLIIKKHNNNTMSLLTISVFFIVLVAKYNTFTLLLFYIIYYADRGNNKYKDYIIGFLLSITIFTKINMGCAFIIPTIILNLKNIKIVLKRFISFSITSLTIIIIMIINGVFKGFINYTILGLLSFSKNLTYDFSIIFIVLSIIYIIKNIKKDKYLIYMLCYLGMSYPLFEIRHIFLAIFPLFVYIIDEQRKRNVSIFISIIVIIISILIFISINIEDLNRVRTIKLKNKYYIQDKDYLEQYKIIHKINQKLSKKRKVYRIFYFSRDSYLFKLDLNENINKYDFIWTGNLGYKGKEKYLREIKDYCSDNKCMFIINKDCIYNRLKNEQINLEILKYVEETYDEYLENEYINETVYSVYTNDNKLIKD